MTLKKTIKLVGLIGVWLMVLATTLPVMASPKIVEGIGLKEPLEVELDFSESDYLLVTASQSHADYLLTLKDKGTQNVIRVVSFPARAGLDEALLARGSECAQCLVVISGAAPVDRASAYRLSIEPISESETFALETFQALTLAGESRYKAEHSSDEERVKNLRKSIKALEVASKSNVRQWRHHALTLMTGVYNFLEEHSAFLQILELIQKESESVNSVYRVLALYDLADTGSNTSEALSLLDAGMDIAETLGDKRLYAIGANFKAIKLVNEARYDEALALLKQANDIFLSSQRWRDLMLPLHNLSWANQRAGNLPASLAVATQQKLLAEKYQEEESVIWALYNFAMTYGQMGDRSVAEQFLDEAIERQANLPEQARISSSALRAWLLMEKTQRAQQFGALTLASDYADLAKLEFQSLGFMGQVANVDFVQGEIAMVKGDYSLARTKFLEVIKFNEDNNRVLLAGVFLLRLAELEMRQANYIDASDYQVQALKILTGTEDHKSLARALSQAVELLHRLGANDDAEQLARRASNFIDAKTLAQDRAKFAYRRALIASQGGANDKALAYLEGARAIIENTLPKVRRRDLRQTYLALQKSIFELNVELVLAGQQPDSYQALMLAEVFKARTLRESIDSMNYKQNISDANVAERARILKAIQQNAVAWHSGEKLETQGSSLLQNTRALSLSLQKLEENIQASRKNFATPDSKKISVLPHVQNNELIAYYFIGERTSWLWVLTEFDQQVYSLPKRSILDGLVNDLLAHITTSPTQRSQSSAWVQSNAITALSDVILAPLQKQLEHKDIELITVVPDGSLHAVPFAPLVTPGLDTPLVADYAIAYAPSLVTKQALGERALRRSPKGLGRTLGNRTLVVADPVSSNTAGLVFDNLQYSAEEAQSIRSLVGDQATVLVADKADKNAFLNHLSEAYSVIHLATHGLLNSREPALSGLLFSASEDSDALWLTPEISRANISADLVVLSACESSVGKYMSGEGLFSLSRAFIEGGANQVLGTLWKVQDRATSDLVKHFYTYLINDGMTVAQALRKAQSKIYQDNNNDWKDPYYWAGFQLLGEGVDRIYASSKRSH